MVPRQLFNNNNWSFKLLLIPKHTSRITFVSIPAIIAPTDNDARFSVNEDVGNFVDFTPDVVYPSGSTTSMRLKLYLCLAEHTPSRFNVTCSTSSLFRERNARKTHQVNSDPAVNIQDNQNSNDDPDQPLKTGYEHGSASRAFLAKVVVLLPLSSRRLDATVTGC